MPNTNNKIPIVSFNKSDICNNIEHPIPSQELNPSSQNIPQTRCAISLINRPQPCCCRDFFCYCHDFSFLPHFFCHTFSAALFLLHFCRDFSAALFSATLFLPHFSAALFLPHFSAALFCHDFTHFFCRTFSAALFCRTFSAALFSINNTCPNNLSQNRYSMIFKCDLNERALPLIYTFM
jgi:hypothetical protein